MSWTGEQVAGVLRPPHADDDKYSRGVLGLVTGSPDYPGAAVLSAEAALRTGIGMLRYLGDAPQLVLARRPEAVCHNGRVDAWVFGSGISELPPTHPLLAQAASGDAPVVCDAGALTSLVLAQLSGRGTLVLTPHAGEAATLLRIARNEVEADPVSAAAQLAATWKATVLLKGTVTHIVGPSGMAEVGPSSAWLATAGTGDVLAGILGALVAANPVVDPVAAAASAAWIHARAAERVGGPLLALELAEAVSPVVRELLG